MNFKIRTRFNGGFSSGCFWTIPQNPPKICFSLSVTPSRPSTRFEVRMCTPIWKPEMKWSGCRGPVEAKLYSLATNWRSKPELVAAFNDLFCRDEWFSPHEQAGSFEIGYQDAGSPSENDLPAILAADCSNRPVLNVVDLRGPESPKQAKPVLARFIAQEVRYLVDRGGIDIQAKNGEPRPLDFGDICILVRGKSDAFFLEPELTDLNIPYSFYKKPGLFLSDEALYLSLVCHAVFRSGQHPGCEKGAADAVFCIRTQRFVRI